jgi:tetratricopeptide (TPR) repeat protein
MRRSRSVQALLEDADRLPPGFPRTAAVEEAVRAADATHDVDAGFAARLALASSAEHGGEPHKALVAITWCLGQIDAHPGRFDIYATYWALKWLPSTLLAVPDVPLEEVDRIRDEVQRRYAAERTGEDAVAKLAWLVPLRTGRLDVALEAHRRWRLLPRSEYSDCRACDVSAEVDLALAVGDTRRALDTARPVLAGRLTCTEEPAGVLASLLGTLWDLGEREEAERLHQWGLRLSRGNPSLVATQAEHVAHLVRTDRLEDALDLLIELVDVCDRGLFSAQARMRVAAAGSSVAAALAVRGSSSVPQPLGARPTDTLALAATFAAEAGAVAAAFDRRNGTDAYSREIAARMTLRPEHPAPQGTDQAPVIAHRGQVGGAFPRRAVVSTAPDGAVSRDAATEGPDALLDQVRSGIGLDGEARLDRARRALTMWQERGDTAGAARARRSIGTALLHLGRDDEGGRELEQALAELSDQPKERVLAALALARLAHGRAGRVDEQCRRWVAAARAAATAAPDADLLIGRCRVVEAEWLVLALGDEEAVADPSGLADAESAYAEARALLDGDAGRQIDAWSSEAWSRGVVGDLDGALAAARTAWQLASAESDTAVAEVAELLIPLLLGAAEVDEALDVAVMAQRAEERAGDRSAAAATALTRADLLQDLDRDADALTAAWEAADLFAAQGDRSGAAWARLTVGRVFRALEQDQTAYDILSELVEQAADDDDRRLEAAVAVDLARLDADYGHLDDALVSARRALGRIPADEPADTGRAYRVLAQLHDARGEPAEAIAASEACLASFAQDDDHVLLARARAQHADRLVLAGSAAAALELYEAARDCFAAEDMLLAVATTELGRADAFAVLDRQEEAVAAAQRAAEVGEQQDVPGLIADALWAVATHSAPEAGRYEQALTAYRAAGAAEEQLNELRARRDEALGRRRSRRKR